MIRKFIFVLLGLFVGMQVIRPEKNLASTSSPDDLNVKYPLSADVQKLLHRACYDCHSNTTKYPWYAEIQPVGWWLAKHVNDGKRHLNFSEFGTYTLKRSINKLEEISDDLSQGAMPLPSYKWGHPEARLTAAEIKLLTDWADNLHDELAPN